MTETTPPAKTSPIASSAAQIYRVLPPADAYRMMAECRPWSEGDA